MEHIVKLTRNFILSFTCFKIKNLKKRPPRPLKHFVLIKENVLIF